MPRRKNPKPETIEEVAEDFSTAENIVDEEINDLFNDAVKPEII